MSSGNTNEFARRHIGPSDGDIDKMLAGQGATDLEGFLRAVVPRDILSDVVPAFAPIELGGKERPHLEEHEVLEKLDEYICRNRRVKSMIGLGYNRCRLPAPIKRLLLESPSWYTAYTPYQAEISQGRLQMLLVYQTMVANLCGLPMANASLLDEATSAAEAMTLLQRVHKGGQKTFIVDTDLHPQTLAVLRTRAEPIGIELAERELGSGFADGDAFGALIGLPGSSGRVSDISGIITELAQKGIKTAVCTDILSLALMTSPGAMGASVAVGSCQRFGLPMGAGGPHAGFMAFEQELARHVPGRLVGLSRDSKGRPAVRLALQTREQHIRRDRAMSNICTAQALPAMIATAYAVYHGPKGLREIAERTHAMACKIADAAVASGLEVLHDSFFDTVRIRHDDPTAVVDRALEAGIDLLPLDGMVGVSCDETTTDDDVEKVLVALGASGRPADTSLRLKGRLLRDDAILTQPVFSLHRSEHGIMRFLRQLADKDIGLDRSMIPLGSCTMKLNAATQMEKLSDPGWTDLHPYSVDGRGAGFKELADDLGHMLAKTTGFDDVSLQPNAGAQGEYAGLLAIRGYHHANGDTDRVLCLVPDSAHGTNPASAVMAGMDVVSLPIDSNGEIIMDKLVAKVEEHSQRLGALMITYPSTCGIYGAKIREICRVVHDGGGQVYMDGANLNAMVGVVLPGELGADVMHINLHKTFCIPHGGGGPGMGPIVCKEHLSPHLPGHPFDGTGNRKGGAVSAAAYGSGSLLAISWAYMRMMGPVGLRKATAVAVLAANHVLDRLRDKYPLAFSSSEGKVAHEFILDMRDFKKDTGIVVEDIAKRLIDMGFHAPTVSFPLPGSFMVEPTESEPLEEMERFCEAMLRIREEIDNVASGVWPKGDNPLSNAPHTAEDLLEQGGEGAYSATEAAFPMDWLRRRKFWPPVSRIDQVFGDRNLRCVLGADEGLD